MGSGWVQPMGYSSFKGLIACFPEVYLRFNGLMPKWMEGKNGGMTRA